MKMYFRRELDNHLVWSDFDMEAAQYIAEKYVQISRAQYRMYKREQKKKEERLTIAAYKINFEQMSEEPYL